MYILNLEGIYRIKVKQSSFCCKVSKTSLSFLYSNSILVRALYYDIVSFFLLMFRNIYIDVLLINNYTSNSSIENLFQTFSSLTTLSRRLQKISITKINKNDNTEKVEPSKSRLQPFSSFCLTKPNNGAWLIINTGIIRFIQPLKPNPEFRTIKCPYLLSNPAPILSIKGYFATTRPRRAILVILLAYRVFQVRRPILEMTPVLASMVTSLIFDFTAKPVKWPLKTSTACKVAANNFNCVSINTHVSLL